MLELLTEALTKNPQLIISIIEKSNYIAQQQLGQDRGLSSASQLFPVEIAIRYLASEQRLFKDYPDSLSSSLWSVDSILDYLGANAQSIAEIAGSNTMAKNLPQRAAHILWLMKQIENQFDNKNLLIIEIGSSATLVSKALRHPEKFKQWLTDKPTAPRQINNILNVPELNVIGVELNPPKENWVLACIGDDDLRDEVRDFTKKFTQAIPQVQGDGLFLPINIKKEITPIVIACAMLYQLPSDKRNKMEEGIKNFIYPRGGLFIKTDPAKYLGMSDRPGNWLSWVENGRGSIVSPKILLSGKTFTQWNVIK